MQGRIQIRPDATADAKTEYSVVPDWAAAEGTADFPAAVIAFAGSVAEAMHDEPESKVKDIIDHFECDEIELTLGEREALQRGPDDWSALLEAWRILKERWEEVNELVDQVYTAWPGNSGQPIELIVRPDGGHVAAASKD